MPESFDLSSATGRKAIEAAVKSDKHAIAAALAVLMDPKCAECQGACPSSHDDRCLVCNGTGQNPEQLVKLSEVAEMLRRDGRRYAAERWARERSA